MPEIITVSAVVIRDERGRVLTVRKCGTSFFMFPGGKSEPGESPAQTAVREFREELGVEVDESNLVPLGTFETGAANESEALLHSSVFEHPFVQIDGPEAEIEELKWFDPQVDAADLAPLLRYQVFPKLGGRGPLKNVAVFTGSASGSSPDYARSAAAFARTVVQAGIGVVYGGGKVGLMGVVADAAMHAGGKVWGVIPKSLVRAEDADTGITRLEVVPDMHTRKKRMAELADGFVALPGGSGTLEELFEVWTWQQLGLHSKPVALLNINGFWQPLIQMLDEMTEQGFIRGSFRQSLIVADSPEELISKMLSWPCSSE